MESHQNGDFKVSEKDVKIGKYNPNPAVQKATNDYQVVDRTANGTLVSRNGNLDFIPAGLEAELYK